MKTRLTLDDIKAVIASENFTVLPDTTTTICWLTLRNGFVCTGESACADPANFDKGVGEALARAKALDKVWLVEGYLLKQQLTEAAKKPLRKLIRLDVQYDSLQMYRVGRAVWDDGKTEMLNEAGIQALIEQFPQQLAKHNLLRD